MTACSQSSPSWAAVDLMWQPVGGKATKTMSIKCLDSLTTRQLLFPLPLPLPFPFPSQIPLLGTENALNGIVSAHFGFSFYCSACEFKWANGKLSTGREHNRARRPEKRATSAITSSLTTFPFWLQLSLNAFSALAQFVASAGERYSTTTQAKPAYLLRAARGSIGNLKLLRAGSIEVNWMNTFIFWQCKSRDSKFKPQLQIQFENSSLGTFESTLRGIPIKYLCYDFPLNS